MRKETKKECQKIKALERSTKEERLKTL